MVQGQWETLSYSSTFNAYRLLPGCSLSECCGQLGEVLEKSRQQLLRHGLELRCREEHHQVVDDIGNAQYFVVLKLGAASRKKYTVSKNHPVSALSVSAH